MDIHLVDIIGVDQSWETQHRVRALEIDKGSPANAGLAELKRNDKTEHARIIRAIKMVASYERVIGTSHVKVDAGGRGVYEMRAKYTRLFFFYTQDTDEIVVCTHVYQKRDSSKLQDKEFAKCAELRDLYEASRQTTGE